MKSPIQMYSFLEKYAVYDYEHGRVATLEETVDKALRVLDVYSNGILTDNLKVALKNAMQDLTVLPSMRLFSQREKAIHRDNLVTFNCTSVPVSTVKSLSLAINFGMSGVGVGYSLQKQHTKNLPVVLPLREPIIYEVIEDTQESWVKSVETLIENRYKGFYTIFDYSKIRPAGAMLYTKSGIASGPEPLKEYHNVIRNVFAGVDTVRQLATSELAYIITSASLCANSGGSRRSASLLGGDTTDEEFLHMKDGNYYGTFPNRQYSNNSVIWKGVVDDKFIDTQMNDMFLNGNGELGIVNLQAFYDFMPERRKHLVSSPEELFTNACVDSVLQIRTDKDTYGSDNCNLITVVVNTQTTKQDIINRVYLGTIIGTIQSNMTHFPSLPQGYKDLCEQNRLIGVAITGGLGNESLVDAKFLRELKQLAIETNKYFAKEMGISESVAITTQKPFGQSSQLTNTKPSFMPTYANYTSRNVVLNPNTYFYEFANNNKLPYSTHPTTPDMFLLHIPKYVDGPDRHSVTAVEQLETWKLWQTNYVEHNASVTIYYGAGEQAQIIDWVKQNKNVVSGITFFPKDVDESVYPYLPEEPITKDAYTQLLDKWKDVDWNNYTGQKILNEDIGCEGGICAIPNAKEE